MTSNKTEYSVMLNENDIHIILSLPPLLMPLIFISFRYNQYEFGVSITSFSVIIDTSKFWTIYMYCAISFVSFSILYAHVE